MKPDLGTFGNLILDDFGYFWVGAGLFEVYLQAFLIRRLLQYVIVEYS